MTNPRFALLLANYRLHDQITLALAGIALAAVLIGWAMQSRPVHAHWYDRAFSNIYFGFLILAFVLTLAGSTYLLLTGGFA